ncbi:MAG: CpsD/CapB family tyrosine-protein kinase, partial [Candidatus Krumholzibacteria bacterium]|nr:CpsD/CapB family tyrosine-protein kinase [Candidatus Krumholzibacteria bacterium]
MSKIYDALRKAERDRGRPRAKPDRAAEAPAPRLRHESVLLAGMDERFHRSLLNLKNAIDSGLKGKESRVILFTSAIAGEGKTTIVASLARVIASGESQKILLVDCSTRNPELHRLFGLKNERGLVDFLAGRAAIKDVIQSVDQGVLDLVAAGTMDGVEGTQMLFGSERFAIFIKEVAAAYEYVLVDSSAILEAPETPILGSRADGIVMVIFASKTRREVIKRAMSMVEKLDGAFIGTVLNRKRYYI